MQDTMRSLCALLTITLTLTLPAAQASDDADVANSGAVATNDSSYECDAADGEVFYQHTPCPDTLPAASSDCAQQIPCDGNTAPVPVRSLQIPREQACREINRAGAIGRKGHERDEVASTYDKNLGRDLCR